MDDLMARTMVENLALGIDPLTGRSLSNKDICSNVVVQEALKTVLDNCTIESYATMLHRERQEKKEAKEYRKEERHTKYPNGGKPWTKEEETKLLALYKTRYSVSRISVILERTPGAIRDRLRKLGYRV